MLNSAVEWLLLAITFGLMTTELRFLATSVVLGLLSLIATSHLISFQRGYRWSASDREEAMPLLHGLANRVDQATTNS